MLLINKLTDPGGVRRVELRLDTIRVVLKDGTERFYVNREQEVSRESSQAIYGLLDTVADRGER